jgi:unsaturated rhamnogalacturonyl hydrolase
VDHRKFQCAIYVAGLLLLDVSLHAQEMPTPEKIVEDMRVANQYLMDKWPDPTVPTVKDKVRPSNIWTRAAYYEGLMALYRVDPRETYYNYAVQWSEGHNWEPAYGGTKTTNADDQCCGQTYIELYQIDPQPERIEKIRATIDRMVNSDENDAWWWIDALQMAMPIFAKLGTIYQDNRYFEKLYSMYYFTKTRHGDNGLYNPDDHLWWRDADFDPPHTSPNGEDTYWSRGNGWVLTALARVLDVLPGNAPHREEYVTTFKEMAEALIPVQREDGFWNVSLHDPDEFGGKETSGTGFFVFGLTWGINHGLLTDEIYKTAVIRGWNGLVNDALHENGFLGYVQGTGKQPSDGQPLSYDKPANFEDYGLGAFLLAGSEMFVLAGGSIHSSVEEPLRDCSEPEQVKLRLAFPNPLNTDTRIFYSLGKEKPVDLMVFDTLGKRIFTFCESEDHEAGQYQVGWSGVDDQGNSAPSGTYIIHLKAGEVIRSRKVIVIR